MFFSKFSILFLLSLSFQLQSAEILDRVFNYQARIALFNAGDLNFRLSSSLFGYSFVGEFQTSGIINKYYSWKGEFAAVGDYKDGRPTTANYYSRSESKDHELKIVLLGEDGIRLLEAGGSEFKSIARPKGDDLISAFFFSSDCYEGNYVNDGEDSFEVVLIKRRDLPKKKSSLAAFRRCYYKVKDYKGRTRKLNVELATTASGIVASEIRIKVPLLPDIVFGLKEVG